jgi:Helix-turn-helix domain
MDIDPAELLADTEVAKILHQRTQTLAAWRSERKGPAYVKVGRRVFYRRLDITKWLGKQLHEPSAA